MEILTEMAGELRTKNPVFKNNPLTLKTRITSVFASTQVQTARKQKSP